MENWGRGHDRLILEIKGTGERETVNLVAEAMGRANLRSEPKIEATLVLNFVFKMVTRVAPISTELKLKGIGTNPVGVADCYHLG